MQRLRRVLKAGMALINHSPKFFTPQNDTMRKINFYPALLISEFLVCLLWVMPSLASAQSLELPDRPETQQLLPETTVGLIKIRSFRDMVAKMKNSSGGQMLQSDSVAPLVNSLYDNATKQYGKVSEQVGLSIEEIQSLPSGEITLAIIAPRRKDLAYVVIMETDEENEAVDKALGRYREIMENSVGALGEDPNIELKSEENEFGVNIEMMMVTGMPVYTCKHKGLFIACTSEKELENMFIRWSGEEVKKVRSLSENRKFITIAKRCAVADDVLPDARFFVDPIGIFKASSRGNVGANFAIALLPTLGLDGLLAAGGDMYIDRDQYESISHLHLLLASPREGVLDALALKPNVYTPEPWVPVEIAQYLTTSWDVPQMLASIKEISDKIVDGKYDEFFENVQSEIDKKELDVNVREDFIDLLSGRISVVRPILSGTELNGIGNVLSLGINDVEKFEETLRKFLSIEDIGDTWSEQQYGGITYWNISKELTARRKEMSDKWQQQQREERGEEFQRELDRPRIDIRMPQPAFGIIGDYLVISDSQEFFELAVDTFNGDKLTLADDEVYLKHADAMTKLLKTDLPAAVFYFDSPREIEFYLKAFSQSSLMEFVELQSEKDESGFVSDMKASIDEHGFPAIEDIKEYLSVSGGFITTDDSGYHLLLFQERPKE